MFYLYLDNYGISPPAVVKVATAALNNTRSSPEQVLRLPLTGKKGVVG